MPIGAGLGYAAGGASQGLLDLWKIRLLEQEEEQRAAAEKFDQMMRRQDYGLREKDQALRQQEAGQSAQTFEFNKQKAAFEAADARRQLLEGQPLADLPMDQRLVGVGTGLAPSLQFPQSDIGQLATPPGMPDAQPIPVLGGPPRIPIGQAAQGVTDIGSAPVRSIRPIEYPAFAGQPATSIYPKSAEEITAAKRKEELAKLQTTPFNVAKGAKVYVGGKVIAEGEPDEGDYKEEKWIDGKGNPVLRKGTSFVYAGTGRPVPLDQQVRRAPPDRDPAAAADRAAAREEARNDRAMYASRNFLEGIRKPIIDVADRIGKLQITLNMHSPAADAAIAPELLIAMAGGFGSGLKMSEAEIYRIVHGRGTWAELEATLNRLKANPMDARSITTSQHEQIQEMVSILTERVRRKLKLIENADDAMADSTGPQQHQFIINGLQKQLAADLIPDVVPDPRTAGTSVLGGKFNVKVPGK